MIGVSLCEGMRALGVLTSAVRKCVYKIAHNVHWVNISMLFFVFKQKNVINVCWAFGLRNTFGHEYPHMILVHRHGYICWVNLQMHILWKLFELRNRFSAWLILIFGKNLCFVKILRRFKQISKTLHSS